MTKRQKYSIDLPGHMAECDANYLRLLKLFPLLPSRDSNQFSLDINGQVLDIRLDVQERSPYTTLLKLSQAPEMPWSRTPSLTIRMYHDARSAEVVEYQGERHFLAVYHYPNETMRHPDEKAQINRFLGEFLSLCLARGIALSAPLLTH
ncbi:MAG: DUF1249 domain-containing protein [Pseudomonadales bacterium]|nr:DUF1249 domain-containing protein [Pseudomonadales bacterium]